MEKPRGYAGIIGALERSVMNTCCASSGRNGQCSDNVGEQGCPGAIPGWLPFVPGAVKAPVRRRAGEAGVENQVVTDPGR